MNTRAKKFLSYYKPYLPLFFADIFCAVLASAAILTLPLCIRYLTQLMLTPDTVATFLTLNTIYSVGAIMVALVIILTACNAFIDYHGHMMGAKMEADMRNEIFEHCQKLSFSFYDEQKTGQLMTRIAHDTFNLSELYHHGPEDIVISLFNFIGASVILIGISPQIGWIVFSFVVCMIIYGGYYSRKMRLALRKNKDRVGDINTQIEDTLGGMRVVQSFANEDIEIEKFAKHNRHFLNSKKETYKAEAYFYDGLIMFTYLMKVTVVVFSAFAIVNSSLDIVDLLTFIVYIGIIIEPIQRLGNFVRLYQEGLAGFERFMEILEIEPSIKDSKDAIALKNLRGEIEFKNISFKYKENGEHVLKNLQLNIKAGEYVALVGPSGVGKTTLCSMIPRFYETNQGQLFIDGMDIKKMTLNSLRKNIGLVQQDVYLFAGTVIDNILYGKQSASFEEVIEASKQANAHAFIMNLPNGYETDIGQRGVKLSGGQKQRLSIARVFLKNPSILIFDEATSALDNESEKAVQDSLEKLRAHRTTIVIAHRLSTVKHAHRILVLTENGIEEEGTHDYLMNQSGPYANLYNMHLKIE